MTATRHKSDPPESPDHAGDGNGFHEYKLLILARLKELYEQDQRLEDQATDRDLRLRDIERRIHFWRGVIIVWQAILTVLGGLVLKHLFENGGV